MRWTLRLVGIILLFGLLAVIGVVVLEKPRTVDLPASRIDTKERLQRGQYLLFAGGCIACHTMEENPQQLLAGGRSLETPFGTFYPPNITADKTHGIGNWSDADFVRAMRYGQNPQGRHYLPAFPFTSYTGITVDDLLALKAYIFSLPVINRANRPHQLKFPASMPMAALGWNVLFFEAQTFQTDNNKSKVWNRGAYLVRHLGHCGECHTPRNRQGVSLPGRELAGAGEIDDEDSAPNITPSTTQGIGGWAELDIVFFLEQGMNPDGDYAGSSMVDVIDHNTSHLTAADRKAIATYLKSVAAIESTLEN